METPRQMIVAAIAGLLLSGSVAAQVDGHGPDAWRVSGVDANDTLNVRTGPGTNYIVVGELEPDASGLKMITCVPYFTRIQYQKLSEAQRQDLPPRWCLVESADQRVSGWASAHYLAEDVSADLPHLVHEGLSLVRGLYRQRMQALSGEAPDPLHGNGARDYFFPDAAARLSQGNVGADPLFGGQDVRITNLQVTPPEENAMYRGMVTINVTFNNFGRPQQALARLRVDTSLQEPALRIMRIEHKDWIFPE